MAIYNCLKCNKIFTTNFKLEKHINKKISCVNKQLDDNLIKQVVDPIQPLNVLDLFCGCGGMSQGLTDAKLNIIAGIDIWVATSRFKLDIS